jgi:predicted dehydrogenase
LIDAVDVVSVATPPTAHHGAVLAAVASGRHVLCDKPVAPSAVQAREMHDAATVAGVQHATGFIWRGDAALGRMRALLADGAVGSVLEIHSTCPLGVPVLPMTWMYHAEATGGALAQHGSHVIDRARWLIGAEILRVSGRLHHDVKEAADIGRLHNVLDAFAWARQNHGTPVPGPRGVITADTGYEFSAVFHNGVRARFWEAWHQAGPLDDQVVVYGETGTLEWRGTGGLFLHRVGAEPELLTTPPPAGSGANTPREVGVRHWAALAGAFVAAIRDEPGVSHPTLRDGWQVAAVSDAVRRSHRTGAWETVS